MEAIRQACKRSKALRSIPDNLDYLSVSGEWGQFVDHEHVNNETGYYYVDGEGDVEYSCENRTAQLLDIQPTGDGMVEFLAYEKWGDRNLNIRWRELREGESGEVEVDEPEEVKDDSPKQAASSESLAKLAALFNG